MEPGQIISERYRLLRLLDIGGMGEVWAARNILTGKNFAIKFLLAELAERSDSLGRFMREAETAGSLNHPSIVDVYDVAQAEDGRPYIVMELLPGESLDARLERAGVLSSFETAAYLSQIADALDVAHRAGVVHRDLSAANIFLAKSADGGRPVPKILDFGVSKTLGPTATDRTQTGHGAVLGCPEFMSPEQARGAETVDARTDVWSLGIVLYQCLTGTAPFKAKNYNALMMAILTRPHRPLLEVAPSVDRELAAIVEGCLAKDRDKRVGSAREVADRLSSIARRLSAAAGVVNAPRRRATDRLPGKGEPVPASRAGGSNGSSGEQTAALRRLKSRMALVSVVSATFGMAVGALVASLFWAANSSAPAPVHGASPLGASDHYEPARRAESARADSRLLETRESLEVAVARGLAVEQKSAGRHP